MATDHAASVSGVALRVTKLGVDGAPIVGTDNAYVTNAFMSLAFTPEYTEGEEVEEKAADGTVCVYYKIPDVLKRVTFELALCAPDPEMYEIIAGGTLLESGTPGDTVGWAAPETGQEATPNGISMEVWSRAIVAGKPSGTNPFWRWVFPYAQMRLTGDRTLENGMMANTFEGYGVGNAAWGDGPVGDWSYTSDRAYQYAREADFPTGINGYQAVVADVP
jgi:hypothetical protein